MRKRASRTKRARVKLPRMFRIVPVRAPKKRRRPTRELMAAGPSANPNPCPDGCVCQGTITIGDGTYWVCVGPDGTITYVRKN